MNAASPEIPDPGPAPDLSSLDTIVPEVYEWYLSDHPWARELRIQHTAAEHRSQLEAASGVRGWSDTMREKYADLGSVPEWYREDARLILELAELAGPFADDHQIDSVLGGAEPDDIVVARLRRQLEHNCSGYRYPQHLIGTGAAAYPPPMEANLRAEELRGQLLYRDSDADDMRHDAELDGEYDNQDT